ADRSGTPLGPAFDAMRNRLADVEPDIARSSLGFGLDAADRGNAAPTLPLDDDARRGRTLMGEVHDNYAAALGGAAGHAGLFGTAPAVGQFARQVLRAARGDRDVALPLIQDLVARFTYGSTDMVSSRTLGCDTMYPTSSFT